MADTLEALTRRRLLEEMLGKVQDGHFAVLVLDADSTRIMSAACRVSELLNFRVSLVDDLFKRREPQRSAAGVYFLTPSPASVARLLEDWQAPLRDGRGGPTYASAHVYFTSKLPPQLLASLRGCPGLVARLKALAEVNLEYLLAGSHSFIIQEPHALETFYGAPSDEGQHTPAAIRRTAARLATVFATLKELPAVRFKFPKNPDMDDEDAAAPAEDRAHIARKLAIELDAQLQGLQASGVLPQTETCEVLILDRGFDTVAPVIHDWTYEPMVYDLLQMRSNVFTYQAETRAGVVEEKTHVLNDKDSLWVKLRHQHIASTFESIGNFKDELMKNSVAQGRGGSPSELQTRDISRMVTAMPQYREQLAQLGVHSEICDRLQKQLESQQLLMVGKLEQDIIFGEANSTEMLAFFTANTNLSPEVKVRLFMCYVATKPEKLDETRAAQWQKVTQLNMSQFLAVSNLEYLGVPVFKRQSKGAHNLLKQKRKGHIRQVRPGIEGDSLSDTTRFRPLLEELFEDLASGKMSAEAYPYVRQPLPAVVASFGALGSSASYTSRSFGGVQSVRSQPTWARRAAGSATSAVTGSLGSRTGSVTTPEHPLATAPSASGTRVGKRIVAFVVGGIVRSEIRVAQQLSQRLGRQITVGSTSIDSPSEFIEAVRSMTPPE